MPEDSTTEQIDISTCVDEEGTDLWYESLRDQVDYHCTFCEGLYLEVEALEEKVKAAYAATARSMKGVYDQRTIATRWFGMWSFAAELLATAQAAKNAHQICGADLSGIQHFYDEALERFQMHCPAQICVEKA